MEFEKGNGMLKPELLEERIFNSITWAPRIWRPWDNLFDCRVLFRSKDIRGGRFVRPILIFRTKRYWILFRIGPERRRKAEMPTDVCLFSNSPDPYPLSKKEECMNHGRGERTDHLPIFYKTMPERI